MSKADLFAYLAAFVTIVLALALSDLLQSAHRLLTAKERVKWDVLSPLLAIWVLLTVVSDFFSLWDDARFERLTFYGLLGFMIGPILITMTAFAVLPDEVPESGLQLRDFYMQRRRYLAVIISLQLAVDTVRMVEAIQVSPPLATAVLWKVVPLLLASIAALSVMMLSRAWAAQLAAILVLLFVGHLGYVGWHIDLASHGTAR